MFRQQAYLLCCVQTATGFASRILCSYSTFLHSILILKTKLVKPQSPIGEPLLASAFCTGMCESTCTSFNVFLYGIVTWSKHLDSLIADLVIQICLVSDKMLLHVILLVFLMKLSLIDGMTFSSCLKTKWEVECCFWKWWFCTVSGWENCICQIFFFFFLLSSYSGTSFCFDFCGYKNAMHKPRHFIFHTFSLYPLWFVTYKFM